ncbi:malto-oligosyltrehalose trehalohydrolase [Gordonia sp. YY1]|uniref:malto-oligosyltrehalose trehalohydrolase n=1 Tax=Gordonia sp. YY1 TaxID=396712 RepID=UPI001331A349|nr:malto-oligosyltrehalose trehalohydrolase [Gordonia sp. YY1]KAF0970519.1 Malto-oligosyltrehalose trehalohydrolase [Gordonia sp. YY1]
MWAPEAGKVDLVVRSGGPGSPTRSVPMSAGAGGWWQVPSDNAIETGPDLRYGFSLDDGPARPDPRSVRQPDGVHELSALFGVDESRWTDDDWAGRDAHGAVIYELHLGNFTPAGTLDSAIERLDHLVTLGVDLVELMPVNAFNGTHNWGYDGVGWYAVHETYGGPAALARFVDACHAKGLGVVLDVVYNHLGPSGNYLPDFGPYLSEGTTSWGSSVNLSGPDSDEVRAFIAGTALRWFTEFHIDGLRLDAVHALADHRAVHILEELAAATDALSAELGRPLSLIAESDLNDPRMIMPRSRGGLGLAAQWDDDIHHAVHTLVSGERQGYYADFGSFGCLAKVLTGGFFHDGTYSSFRRRCHGRPIPTDLVPASSLLAYTCTHDQVGNRAIGDRPSAYLDGGQLAIKAALVLLSPYTPMLFMGEEWGAATPFQFFTSHPEPELGRATAQGRKAEFAEHGWDSEDVPDPQDPETFERSKLDWSELTRTDHVRVLDFYRSLIALRKAEPALHDPAFASVDAEFDEAAGWFAMHRGDWSVVCVPGDAPVTLPWPLDVRLAWEQPDDGVSPGHNVIVGVRRDS